jgi:hypothetical protein
MHTPYIMRSDWAVGSSVGATRWLSIAPWPLRPLGQVGTARADRAARVAKGSEGRQSMSPRWRISFFSSPPRPLQRFQKMPLKPTRSADILNEPPTVDTSPSRLGPSTHHKSYTCPLRRPPVSGALIAFMAATFQAQLRRPASRTILSRLEPQGCELTTSSGGQGWRRGPSPALLCLLLSLQRSSPSWSRPLRHRLRRPRPFYELGGCSGRNRRMQRGPGRAIKARQTEGKSNGKAVPGLGRDRGFKP